MISAVIFFSVKSFVPGNLKVCDTFCSVGLWPPSEGLIGLVWAVIELIGFPPQQSCSSQKCSLDLKEISGKAID